MRDQKQTARGGGGLDYKHLHVVLHGCGSFAEGHPRIVSALPGRGMLATITKETRAEPPPQLHPRL